MVWLETPADNKQYANKMGDWTEVIGGGETYGLLAGLEDDDHPQYLNDLGRYYNKNLKHIQKQKQITAIGWHLDITAPATLNTLNELAKCTRK